MVTGGASGIGLGVAKRLGKRRGEGHPVRHRCGATGGGADRPESADLKVETAVVDVTNEEQV